jgi:hypothetical protein
MDADPLLRALAAPCAQVAAGGWQAWKQSIDVHELPLRAMQIIPALGPRLWDWLREDPSAGIFQGVVRRAWSEAQVRLTAARGAIESIESAGGGPVLLAGPPLVSLLARAAGPVRPIPVLRIAVRRELLQRASAALQSAGWALTEELPPASDLDWVSSVFLARNDVGLLLHWRLLPAGGSLAARCEADLFEGARRVHCGGISTWIPSPEHALLALLSERSDPDPDTVPWEVDAALFPLGSIDWERWSAIAAKYAPEAFDRLAGMRALGLEVPRLTRPAPQEPVAPTVRPEPFPTRLYRALRRRARRVVRRCLV